MAFIVWGFIPDKFYPGGFGIGKSRTAPVLPWGGRLVRHARYYWLLLAEGHLSQRLFGSMLRRIAALPLPDG
jgi:hypothetical protein